MMILLLLLLLLVISQYPNEKGSSLAMIPMGYIVAHTRHLMMVKIVHKPSDFSWIYKGWKNFNEKYSAKNTKIDFSQHPLDKSQFQKN
jgi:hypothetical protein